MNEKVLNLAQQRVDLELAGASEALEMAVLEVVQNASARGMLRSGGTAKMLYGVFRNEARNRVRTIWTIMHRIVSSSNIAINDEVTANLAAQLEELSRTHAGNLPALYAEKTTKYVDGKFIEDLSNSVSDDLENEIKVQLNELDLFAMNYQSRTEQSGGNVFNIYGPTGSIQTGSNSTANVNMQINSAAELIQLLKEIDKDLDSMEHYPENDRTAVKDIIQDGIIELEKQSPNKLKLKGAVAAIADTFSKVDSAISGGQKIYEWGQKLGVLISSAGGFFG